MTEPMSPTHEALQAVHVPEHGLVAAGESFTAPDTPATQELVDAGALRVRDRDLARSDVAPAADAATELSPDPTTSSAKSRRKETTDV